MSAAGVQKWIWGLMWGRWVGGGVGSISKNRLSHHKYKSAKRFVNRILEDYWAERL